MSKYKVLTVDSAPEKSRQGLQALQSAFGFIPNVAGTIANSPTLINSLASVFGAVHSGPLSDAEIQILLLTNAVTNKAQWPVAFHSTLALDLGVDAQDVENIRRGRKPKDARSAALWSFAKALIENRGHVQPQDQEAIASAGFNDEQMLSVIAVTAASTITNYGASLTNPPLEDKFQVNSWESPA